MDLTRPYPPDPYSLLPVVPSFALTSKDIRDGEFMDVRHSIDGSGVSPQLSWSGAPDETAAFALSCFDPDAPTPSGFWHWTIVNLPPTMTSVPRDFGNIDFPTPAGVVRASTDGGTLSYYPAAPPPGDHEHRYFFVVHALDSMVEAKDGIGCTLVSLRLVAKTIARATLVGKYQR